MTDPICIFGPTAAGKTALSIALAQRLDGVIINADAMQVYRDLRVITARPSAAEEAQAPHRLFGILDAADPCNAVRWAALARQELGAARQLGKQAIIVGGTGMYFRALLEGLDDIPPIDPALRAELRQLSLEEVRAALGVTVGDRQRLTRQLEVLRQTGQTLESFQARKPAHNLPHKLVVISPPRDQLYARIDLRFELMLAHGTAQAEVQALLARGLATSLPCMRAIGVPELARVWSGEQSLDSATAAAQQASRRYAKRQVTWARNQMQPDFLAERLLDGLPAVVDTAENLLKDLSLV